MADSINGEAQSGASVAVAPTEASKDFAASVLNSLLSGAAPQSAEPQPAVPAAEPQPAVPPPVAPMPAPPVQPPVQPAVPPPVQPPMQPPAQPPVPPVIDFTTRYANTPSDAPQLDLTPLPDLPAEPQVALPQDGQQIPNAAFAAMRAGYGQMRHTAEDYRNKYNRLIEDTKRFQGEKAEFAAQLNAKDEEIKNLRDEIGRSDLSKSPEFQEKYDAPIRAATDKVAELLLANGIDKAKAIDMARDIIAADQQERPGKIADLPTYVQGMIMVQAQGTDQLWTARDEALRNWRQSAEGLAAVAARGSAIIDAQRTQQLADQAIGTIKGLPPEKGLPPAFQVTDPTFVADRDAKEQLFRSWVQQAPEEQKMAAMFEGFMAPKTYEMVDNVFRENLQLKQMLYARTRVDAPPIAAMRMPQPSLQPGLVRPQAPQQPATPQQPTVQQNGWSVADTGLAAQQFAQAALDQMRTSTQALPVI